MGNAVWQGTGLGSLEARDLGSNPSVGIHPETPSSSLSLHLCICKMVMMVRRHFFRIIVRFREIPCEDLARVRT